MSLSDLLTRIRFQLVRKLDLYKGNAEYRWTHRADGDRELIVYRAPHGAERTLRVRRGSTDLRVFADVFQGLSYSTLGLSRHRDIEARYRAILRAGKRPLIIDAGANVGMASLYFSGLYPDAALVAIEPDGENYAELLRHVDTMASIMPLRAALSPQEGHVEVVDTGDGAWGQRTKTAEAGVPAHTLRRIVELAGERWDAVPFLLKIDIEGFEAGLFDDATDIADRFYVMMVEPHDWMLPRQGSSTSLLRMLASLDRDFLIRRENILSISNTDPASLSGSRLADPTSAPNPAAAPTRVVPTA